MLEPEPSKTRTSSIASDNTDEGTPSDASGDDNETMNVARLEDSQPNARLSKGECDHNGEHSDHESFGELSEEWNEDGSDVIATFLKHTAPIV